MLYLRKFILIKEIIIFLILLPCFACAHEKNWETENRFLKIKSLENKLQVSEQSFQTVYLDKVDEKENKYVVNWLLQRPPVYKNKNFSIRFNARIAYDYANVSYKDGNGKNKPRNKVNSIYLRNLEFGLRGNLFSNFNYRVVTKFTDNITELKMAYLGYETENTKLAIGQTRTFTTLDKTTPPTMMAFTERFSFINAIKAPRRLGFTASRNGSNWSFSSGYFIGNTNENKINDNRMVSARINFSPQFKNGLSLHFGASTFYRNQNSKSFSTKYEARPLSKHGNLKPLFSGNFDIEEEQFIAAEFVASYKSFAFQVEYATIKTPLSNLELKTSTDPTYKGGYLEVGFFPTGGKQLVDGRVGRLDNVKIKSPIGKGGVGEVRIAVRYDMADFTHEGYGSKQSSYILSLDWYLNTVTKITTNYAHSIIQNSSNVVTVKADTINTRFSFFF